MVQIRRHGASKGMIETVGSVVLLQKIHQGSKMTSCHLLAFKKHVLVDGINWCTKRLQVHSVTFFECSNRYAG